MRTLIAIDPGQEGGIAHRDTTGIVRAVRMPETPAEICRYLAMIKWESERVPQAAHLLLENVGFYRPGNSGPASCKFARHVGALEGIVIALGLSRTYVTPQQWMRVFLVGNVPKDKTVRKNAIKDKVRGMYPSIRVTLATSDALGMLVYMMKGETE